MRKDMLAILLQAILISFAGFFLWFRIELPYSYLLTISSIGIVIALSIQRRLQHGFVLVQIFMIFLLINNVYGLATHYSVLPYGDSYWDYSVVRTFLQEQRIFTIPEQIGSTGILTWYSGWPLIHSLAVLLCQMSGLSPYYAILLIPIAISICSFLVIYLILKRLQTSLDLARSTVYFGMLIYVLSPDTLFWRTQFVRLCLGSFWVLLLFYFVCLLVSKSARPKREVALLTITVAFALVTTHHLASFIAMAFFFLLFIFQVIGKRIGTGKIRSTLFGQIINTPILSLAVLMTIVIFVWWNNFGAVIWPTIASGTERLIRVVTGAREVEFYVPQAHYPVQLTPIWALVVVRLRDIITLVPSLVGLSYIWIKKPAKPEKFLAVYSMLAFGLLFLINDVTFKIEPFRLVALGMPFLALLSGATYSEAERKLKRLSRILLPSIIIVLVLSSFLGLWGHNFAPVHLYDSSISGPEVGENIDATRLAVFFKQRVVVENLWLVWTDGVGSTIMMLNYTELYKIRRIMPEYVEKMGSIGGEVVAEFNNFFVYRYYAGIYSPVKSPEEAKAFGDTANQRVVSRFNRVYDDGLYRLWWK